MKTTRHSLLIKGMIVLLSLSVLIFAATFSWFTIDDPDADATGFSARTEATGDFEYAIGFYNSETMDDYAITPFTNDTTALNLESLEATIVGQSTAGTYNLLHDYVPIDVTGNGATLIRPSMMYGNSQVNTDSDDYSIADPNVQYINFDLFFRSESTSVPVKLANGSYAIGAAEIKGNGASDVGASSAAALKTSSSASSTYGFNPSTYGTFSKDAIVGAVRIAFVPYTMDSTHVTASNILGKTDDYLSNAASFVWVPRPDLHANTNDTTSGWTLANATYPASYTTADAKHQYYGIFENSKTTVDYATANTVTPTSLQSGSKQFTSITGAVKIGSYYYTKVNVRIWIEGTDNEARRAFSGGRFAVNFKFSTN